MPNRFVDLLPHDIERLGTLAAESSLPTHASSQCVSACRYFALVMDGLMHVLARERVLSPSLEPLAELRAIESLHPAVDAADYVVLRKSGGSSDDYNT